MKLLCDGCVEDAGGVSKVVSWSVCWEDDVDGELASGVENVDIVVDGVWGDVSGFSQ